MAEEQPLEYLITWWESNMGTPGCVQTEDPKNASCMCHSYSYLPLLHQGWCWHVVSLPCHWLLSHNTMTVQEPAANTTFIESDSFCIQIMNFTMRRGWQLPRCISVHSLIFYQWMLSRCHWRLEMTLICFQFIQEVTLSLTCKKKKKILMWPGQTYKCRNWDIDFESSDLKCNNSQFLLVT